MNLVRTKIESYEFMNGNNLININSDQTSTVTISQTTFTYITQTGAGKGSVINAQLDQDSILKVTDSCTFYNCSTQQYRNCTGGAIYARVDGSNSQFIVSDLVKFDKCQSYQGGAISVELLNMGTCEVNNVQFKECTVNGGGIFAQLQETGGILTITNHTSFVQCVNGNNDGGGINIVINGSNSRCIISDKVVFEKCEAGWGGAIYIDQNDGASFDVHNVTFKDCDAYNYGGAIYIEQREGGSFDVHNVIFEKCQAQTGSAIYIEQRTRGSFDIHNVLFEKCEAYLGGAIFIEQYFRASFEVHNVTFDQCICRDYGGALFYSVRNQNAISSCILDGVQFIDCSIQYRGGSMYIQEQTGTATINGSTFSGSVSIRDGGAIYAQLRYDAELIIENTQFKDCYSANSDGGSILASINNGSLIVNKVTFVGSSCSQPGSGGAIAIEQNSSDSRISIIESSFTNCHTLSGSSSRYGWGGAIYINIKYNPPTLTVANFNLTDLTFSDCTAIENIGNNLHILSDDRTAVGNQIKTESLLTVTDLSDLPNIISDLYTSLQYAYDYMGINQSKVGDGYAQFTDHEPLFEQFFISNVPNPSYIDAINGKDIKFCGGQSSKCKTIKYSTERNPTPLSGIIPTDSSYSIILTSNTESDTDIQIMSTTLNKGHVVIQSDGYNSIEDYTKQSILTSSKTQSLFTITGSGHLELLRLHFDNLNPTSNNPLISISADSDFPPQLQIEDCEFSQDPDSYSIYQLSHSIISISGGIMKLVRTKIENYEFMNGNSLININSDQTSTVTISQTTFTYITQTGAGKGSVINAQLDQDSVLKVTDSCIFYNCLTQQNEDNRGGAINAVVSGSNSQFIVSDLVKFDKCQSFQGGAVSVELLNMGTCEVNNVQFKECTVNNDGGGIFAQLQNSGGTLTITNHTSFVQCINTRWGGGGILIFSDGSNSRCIISDNVTFEKCDAEWGGAIYIEQYDGAKFEIHNVIFKECKAQAGPGGAIFIGQYEGVSFTANNVKFKECEAGRGGAIYIAQGEGGSFDVHNVQFTKCISQYDGGALFYQSQNQNAISSCILDGAQFIDCSSQYDSGSIEILEQSGTATISGSTFSGSKSVYEGGAIYTELYDDAALTIDNTLY
ncbi:MAG: hypothetical protein EZS28_029940 [Streblomastix strix]|uniref:Uncharacterized protein n=1 Tax=Streblomastix strix TaxID=222440 RepID=A0A5J4UW43_9EUKA|nr:MAG: hypothetical protein EZS28_029940 [Streblomastix strix]